MTVAWESFTNQSFEEAMRPSSLPVLVEYWAQWCAPCESYEPTVVAVVEEFSDQLTAGRVNVGAFPDIADTSGISSVPALVLFQDGVAVRKIFGVRTARFLRDELRDQLHALQTSTE